MSQFPANPTRRTLGLGGLALGALALLPGCEQTQAVTSTVQDTMSRATSGALTGVGNATGTRLGPNAVEGLPVSATVQLRSVQAAWIGSGTTGSGTLHFQGRPYRFRITGAGLGGTGVSTVEATGDVFNLTSPAQFGGTYGQFRHGMAVGTASTGELWLQNDSGVIMRLRARRRGLMLATGVDGMLITMARQ
jgi:hypothetical protein